jgi:hypothetical protein
MFLYATWNIEKFARGKPLDPNMEGYRAEGLILGQGQLNCNVGIIMRHGNNFHIHVQNVVLLCCNETSKITPSL